MADSGNGIETCSRQQRGELQVSSRFGKAAVPARSIVSTALELKPERQLQQAFALFR